MDNIPRAELINDIEHLFPPDTHAEGRELLIEALCESWRDLPLQVLQILRHKCIQKDGS